MVAVEKKKEAKKESGKKPLIGGFSAERHQTALSLDISTWHMHAFLKRVFPPTAHRERRVTWHSGSSHQSMLLDGRGLDGGRFTSWSHFQVRNQSARSVPALRQRAVPFPFFIPNLRNTSSCGSLSEMPASFYAGWRTATTWRRHIHTTVFCFCLFFASCFIQSLGRRS